MKNRILITCSKDVPPSLERELVSLGFPVLSLQRAGVETEGTLDDCLRLNLHLRTGHRVLYQLDDLSARTADELYRRVFALPWEDSVAEDGYLCVTASVENPTIKDSRFAGLRVKDAIVDRIREKTGRRPDSGPERDGTVVHLYWKDERAAVYLDTSGEPLSRRGYRKIPMAAPMQETLAAAVILAAGWDGSGNFVSPMCGSGTLAIEAALIGLNRAPGLLRNNFGFMHVKGWNEKLWNELRGKARQEEKESPAGRIIATDIDPRAIDAAGKNAEAAGVAQLIEFLVCDFAETPIPVGGGVVILNPEYGERMGEEAKLESVYKGIGDFFKQKCRGYTGYVFTGSPALAKKIGLRAKRRVPFMNSGIECRLLEYELYEGTRRAEKKERP